MQLLFIFTSFPMFWSTRVPIIIILEEKGKNSPVQRERLNDQNEAKRIERRNKVPNRTRETRMLVVIQVARDASTLTWDEREEGARICQGWHARAQIYKAAAVLRPRKVPFTYCSFSRVRTYASEWSIVKGRVRGSRWAAIRLSVPANYEYRDVQQYR